MFKHNALLLNYYHHGKIDMRQKMKIPDEITVIGDSGGFEILSQRAKEVKLNISPLEVLRWEEANCNIGIILDLSPTNLDIVERGKSRASAISYVSQDVFVQRLEETCKNNQIFQDYRQNKNLKICNIVHSGAESRPNWINIWYERVKDFKFEWWGIAPKPPNDPIKVAVDGMFLYSRGIRENLHVLGISGFHTLPVIVYMEQFIKPISTDSFSCGVSAIIRKYMSFWNDLFFRPAEKKYTKVPCLCPVCSKIVSVEDLYRADIVGYGLITLHNLWSYLSYLQYLETLIKDPELFEKHYEKNIRLKTAIDFIDNTLTYGWEEAISKLGFVNKTLESW